MRRAYRLITSFFNSESFKAAVVELVLIAIGVLIPFWIFGDTITIRKFVDLAAFTSAYLLFLLIVLYWPNLRK